VFKAPKSNEQYFLKCVEEGKENFFTMLTLLFDFVDYKLRKVSKYEFYDTRSEPSRSFKNYFEYFKSKLYNRMVDNLRTALSLFLGSIPMILFQDLESVPELVQHLIKQASSDTLNQKLRQ
jgi:hypothetical protein